MVEVEAFPFQVVEVESPLVVEEAYQNLEVKEGIPSEVEEVAFLPSEEVAEAFLPFEVEVAYLPSVEVEEVTL